MLIEIIIGNINESNNKWKDILSANISDNFLIPIYFIVTEVYMRMKFSGSPFIDEHIRYKCSYTFKLAIFIASGRILQACFNIWININYNEIANTID